MERHDHIDWTRDQLNDEIDAVRELLTIPSSPERDERLERRLGRAIFELWARSSENSHQSTPELV